MVSFGIENQYKSKIFAGVDEAGRGPLAGPVMTAAIVDQDYYIDEAQDSKKIPKKKRQNL